MTAPRRPAVRLTEPRVVEIHEELGGLKARLQRLEEKEEAAAILAEEIATASVRALNRMGRSLRKPTPKQEGL